MAGIFSSVANWATVLLDIRLSSLYAANYKHELSALRRTTVRRVSFLVEPVGAGTHDQIAGFLFL
ncbi:hypothetical protein OMF49_20675, partial [Bordetella pertussis]